MLYFAVDLCADDSVMEEETESSLHSCMEYPLLKEVTFIKA